MEVRWRATPLGHWSQGLPSDPATLELLHQIAWHLPSYMPVASPWARGRAFLTKLTADAPTLFVRNFKLQTSLVCAQEPAWKLF
jgi:hypothetical protein